MACNKTFWFHSARRYQEIPAHGVRVARAADSCRLPEDPSTPPLFGSSTTVAVVPFDFLAMFPHISYERLLITMARPRKQRYIGDPPRIPVFKPQGIPVRALEVLVLTLDEFEALRLADVEGDQHEDAAAKMNISRPTFGRILESAHRTVAEALLKGKALHIQGGPVTIAKRGRLRCRRCRHAWDVPVPAAPEFRCPRCYKED